MEVEMKPEEALIQQLNYVCWKLNDIEAHNNTVAKLQRYREWRELIEVDRATGISKLNHHGYKVYSQNDQDGMIDWLFRGTLDITHSTTFIEFGCGDGVENNTHWQLIKGWRGIWIEADEETVKNTFANHRRRVETKQLLLKCKAVDPSNVNSLLREYMREAMIREEDLSILSIDTDWHDYWILKALELRPILIIIEYNASIPYGVSVTVPEDSTPDWKGDNYFGASFSAISDLAAKKGYKVVGASKAGTDMFLLRGDIDCGFVGEYEPPRYDLCFKLGHNTGPEKWQVV